MAVRSGQGPEHGRALPDRAAPCRARTLAVMLGVAAIVLALRGVRADGAPAADTARRPQITETS
jgi:hypothetical protein